MHNAALSEYVRPLLIIWAGHNKTISNSARAVSGKVVTIVVRVCAAGCSNYMIFTPERTRNLK